MTVYIMKQKNSRPKSDSEYGKKNKKCGRVASETRAVAPFIQGRPPIVFRSSMKFYQQMLN